jgi:hypothetical protein
MKKLLVFAVMITNALTGSALAQYRDDSGFAPRSDSRFVSTYNRGPGVLDCGVAGEVYSGFPSHACSIFPSYPDFSPSYMKAYDPRYNAAMRNAGGGPGGGGW